MLLNYVLLYIWLSFTTFLNMFFTVSGSGVVNPILAVLTDPYRAIGIGYLAFLIGNIQRVYLFRKNIFGEEKNVHYLKIMIPVSIVGAIFGGLLLSNLNIKLMFVLIIFSSVYFIFKTLKSLVKENPTSKSEKINLTAIPVALFTGFLQGSSLPGVDIRNNFLRSHISEVSVRSVSSTIGLFNFIVVSSVMIFSQRLLKTDLIFILAYIPAIFLTQYVGKYFLVKLKDRTAKLIALTMSIFSLLILIASVFK